MKKTIIILLIASVALLAGCKTQEVPGRRRAPRHCNTCTKWSYVPQDVLKHSESTYYEA